MTHSPKTSLKQTNIPWIWEIPKDWKVVKVKQIVSVKITDWPHETPELLLEWVPFASVESVYDGKINFESIRGFISKEQDKIYSQKCKPQRNDICIVKSWSTTGKIAIIEEDIDFNIWSPLALVRVQRDSYAYKFIYYFFTSESFQKQIQTFWSFGTQPNIGMWVIENLHISLPSLLVQIAIANFLDAKTEQISTLISNKKKLIELLKEQKQSIIHSAVTKGIDENVKMKVSWISWIGEIPEDWEILKLKYTGKIINWSTPSSSEKDYWDWDIDWITPTDLGNSDDPNLYQSGRKITKLWLENCGTTIVPKNSIILSCRAPIWSLGITTKDMCTNQGCKAFIVNSRVIYQYVYFHFIAYNEYLQSLWKWTTFQELSTTEFENSYFILPSIITQESIVEYIKKEAFQIDSAIYKIEQEITLIEEYRTSLIYQAVTGKLSIS